MEIHKCNGVIVSPDSGNNSIRKTQIDAFTQNDKEGSPSIIETFSISRLRPSEDNELTFEIEDLETYKLNLEHPLHPSERDEQQKQKLHYTMIANHQKYYFFKVTGCGDSIYF
jgi:ankyrin repeat protein